MKSTVSLRTWWIAWCLALCVAAAPTGAWAQGGGQQKTPKAAASAPTRKPKDATAKCTDGSYSTSAQAAGTCAGHGGVAKWYATARCNDGTLALTASRSGACAGHQGVAEWIKGKKSTASGKSH